MKFINVTWTRGCTLRDPIGHACRKCGGNDVRIRSLLPITSSSSSSVRRPLPVHTCHPQGQRSSVCPHLRIRSPSPSSQSHKKNLAVKRQDGEPLTRVDLQYDLLDAIFSDKHAVFTDPYTTIRGDPAGTRVTFRDLYVNALIHSPKCSKASRDKIRESPLFGNEFAMISLLSNVGRINTTMACGSIPL